MTVVGLRSKVLLAGVATGVASVRSCWKLPLCPMEAVPSDSKMDLLLIKAKPISDGDNVFKKKKKNPV